MRNFFYSFSLQGLRILPKKHSIRYVFAVRLPFFRTIICGIYAIFSLAFSPSDRQLSLLRHPALKPWQAYRGGYFFRFRFSQQGNGLSGVQCHRDIINCGKFTVSFYQSVCLNHFCPFTKPYLQVTIMVHYTIKETLLIKQTQLLIFFRKFAHIPKAFFRV